MLFGNTNGVFAIENFVLKEFINIIITGKMKTAAKSESKAGKINLMVIGFFCINIPAPFGVLNITVAAQ